MTNPHDPAFPCKDHMADGPDGLTKREYFAAIAMQALLTIPNLELNSQQYANDALLYADALIKELSK